MRKNRIQHITGLLTTLIIVVVVIIIRFPGGGA